MDSTSGAERGKIKACAACGESMLVTYGTCPRCGHWHGAPEANNFLESLCQNENKRKTKKKKMENKRPDV